MLVSVIDCYLDACVTTLIATMTILIEILSIAQRIDYVSQGFISKFLLGFFHLAIYFLFAL